MKKLLRVFSAIILLSLVLSACSGTQARAKAPLRVGWSLWPGWYPLIIADQKGFFTEQGLEVDIVYYNTGAEVTAAVASGMVDVGFMVLNDMLLDHVADSAKAVMITDNSDGADQIVATSDIVSTGDMLHKRIGARRGSFGEFFVREMLIQKGISPSDVIFVDQTPETMPDALPNIVDMGHTFEPFTSEARAKGYRVIFTSAETPGLIVDVLASRNNIIEGRPEDIKAFINAWFEAVQYWQDNPEESNALIASATGQKPEDISNKGVKLFNHADNLNAFRPGSDTTSVYFTARKAMKFLIDSGLVAHPVDPNEALDASFLQ
jgi:NitT/TauT family transport system substrate-binding protein